MQYILAAVVFLFALATALLFHGFTAVMFWSAGALVLAWGATRWKGQPLSFAAVGLFILTAMKLMMTAGAFRYSPMENPLFIVNARGFAFLALSAALAASGVLFRNFEDKDNKLFRSAFHWGWCVFIFLLLTVETSDYFLRLMTRVPPETRAVLDMYRRMFLAAIWMVYSMPLLWFGLRKQIAPLFLGGIAFIAIAAGLGGTWGMSYTPIERFVPFTNVRAAVLAFLVLGIVLHTQWLAGARRRYHRLEALMNFTWGLLLFELVTVETNDYFRRLIEFAPASDREGLLFARMLTLAAVWMVLSLPLVRLGLARKMRPILYLGLWSLLLSIGMAGIRGISFDPIERYSSMVNYRTIVLALVIGGTFIHARWIKYSGQLYGVLYEVLNALRIAIALLVLVLLTGEIRDHFEHQAFMTYHDSTSKTVSDQIYVLELTKQFSLSAVWLLTSLALMATGIKRKVLNLRILAIPIFVAAVVKILLFDISSFDMIYRILASLGLIGVGVACYMMFRHYRATLFAATTFDEDQKGRDHIVI